MKTNLDYIIYSNEIAAENLEMQNSLIGLEISDAKKLFGYWWILENSCLNNQIGGTYWFSRSGKGKIQLKTDRKNIVIGIESFIFTTN